MTRFPLTSPALPVRPFAWVVATAWACLSTAQAQDTGGVSGASSGASPGTSGSSFSPGAVLPSNGTLPATGTSIRTGDLRGRVNSLFDTGGGPTGAGGVQPPRWLFTPSVGVEIGATDNALELSSPRRADGILLLTPSIVVNGDTARTQVNLSYTPTLVRYLSNSSQDQIAQVLDASGSIALVPGSLFLDLRGSISQSSLTGGYGSGSTSFGQGVPNGVNLNNQVQTATVVVSPYYTHRFGGWGNSTVGYSLAYTTQDSQGNNSVFNQGLTNQGLTNQTLGNPAVSNQLFGPNSPFLLNSPLTTNREYAQFQSGENLGRVAVTGQIQATQYSGGGVYNNNSHRNTATVETAYAIDRLVAAIGRVGYEDILYGGIPPTMIKDAIWGVGARLTPGPDSTLTVLYGHQDGFNSFQADGSLAPTARTRVLVRYSAGLTTDEEDLQNLAASTSVDVAGNTIDSRTGVPVQATSDLYGIQNNLERLSRLSITGLLSQNRDTFSATLSHEQRKVIALAAFNIGANSSTGIYGSVQWQHDLSQRLHSSASAEYGIDKFSAGSFLNGANGSNVNFGAGTDRTLGANAILSYDISPTATGTLRYSYINRSGPFASVQFNGTTGGGSVTENLVFLGVRKSF